MDESGRTHPAVLATRDQSVADSVSATALALGVALEVVADREELRARWARAPLRLVGSDLASRLDGLGSAPGETFVVGPGDATLLAASAELRAPALALPHAAGELAEVLTQRYEEDAAARVVAVVGASGGLGVSSLTAGLGCAARAAGLRAAVVELASCGGGVDLLFGAETRPGLRWDALAQAVGQLGDLGDQLLTASGVSVLALSREGAGFPGATAVGAVVRSLSRSHGAVVVDAGDGERLGWLGRRARPVLLVGADVRSVAAARQRAAGLALGSAGLVVRQGPGRTLPPDAVASALGLPLLGALRHAPDVPRLAAGASVTGSRRLAADARRLWQRLAG